MENQPSKNHPNRHHSSSFCTSAALPGEGSASSSATDWGFKSQLPAAPGFAGAQEKPPAGRGQQTC